MRLSDLLGAEGSENAASIWGWESDCYGTQWPKELVKISPVFIWSKVSVEGRANIREVLSYQSSAGCFGPLAA